MTQGSTCRSYITGHQVSEPELDCWPMRWDDLHKEDARPNLR